MTIFSDIIIQTKNFLTNCFKAAGLNDDDVNRHLILFFTLYSKKIQYAALEKALSSIYGPLENINKENVDEKKVLSDALKLLVSPEFLQERADLKIKILKQQLESFFQAAKENIPADSDLFNEYQKLISLI